MHTVLIIRPRAHDPSYTDPERDLYFVANHVASGWNDTLAVSEVNLDSVLSSLTDCAQLALALLRNVEKLNQRITKTLI